MADRHPSDSNTRESRSLSETVSDDPREVVGHPVVGGTLRTLPSSLETLHGKGWKTGVTRVGTESQEETPYLHRDVHLLSLQWYPSPREGGDRTRGPRRETVYDRVCGVLRSVLPSRVVSGVLFPFG